MKPNLKKLALHRETVRVLQDPELRLIAGGQVAQQQVVVTAGGCTYCVCWSTSTTMGLAHAQLAGAQAAL